LNAIAYRTELAEIVTPGRKAILNAAGLGEFFSDRTIAEYAASIWNAEPYPVS
jgi:glucan phosphorylase